MTVSTPSLTDHGADQPAIVGVLGGMGPAATADFFAKLVDETPATRDQDHLRTLIWSDSSVPDRTEALLGTGESPLPRLLLGARFLASAGADLIAVPCNSAHVYLQDLQDATGVPVLSMIAATVAQLLEQHPHVNRVGLLATTSTLTSGLYRQALKTVGVSAIEPPPLVQERCVSSAIRNMKSGRLVEARSTLQPALRYLETSGADVVIAACTEIPIIVGRQAHIIDSTLSLARHTVASAVGCGAEPGKEQNEQTSVLSLTQDTRS